MVRGLSYQYTRWGNSARRECRPQRGGTGRDACTRESLLARLRLVVTAEHRQQPAFRFLDRLRLWGRKLRQACH